MRIRAHIRETKHMTITELIAIIFFALAFAGFLTAAQEIGKAILLDDEGNQVDSDKADDRQIRFTMADKKACQREVSTSRTANNDAKTEEPA